MQPENKETPHLKPNNRKRITNTPEPSVTSPYLPPWSNLRSYLTTYRHLSSFLWSKNKGQITIQGWNATRKPYRTSCTFSILLTLRLTIGCSRSAKRTKEATSCLWPDNSALARYGRSVTHPIHLRRGSVCRRSEYTLYLIFGNKNMFSRMIWVYEWLCVVLRVSVTSFGI